MLESSRQLSAFSLYMLCLFSHEMFKKAAGFHERTSPHASTAKKWFPFCFNLLRLFREFSRSFNCLWRWWGQSVSQPVSQSLESQLVSQPVGYCFSQAASHLTRQLANQWARKPTNQTAGQPGLLLIHSSAADHQQSSCQAPSRWACRPVSQPVSHQLSYIFKPYFGETFQAHTEDLTGY